MTLAEGKKKVYQLLDEYSSGGTVTEDADIELKMAALFDIAQKHVAQIRHIRKTTELDRDEDDIGTSGVTEFSMPSDFLKCVAVWRDGTRCKRYQWKAGKLLVPNSDTADSIEVEYFALPSTIDESTEDSYEFEVNEEAANALPFFVASQQLITDLVIDYAGLYAIYNNMLALLAEQEAAESGGGAILTNTFFRG